MLDAVALHHAIRDLHVVAAHADGHFGAMILVEAAHGTEIHLREDVPVDHQDRLSGAFEQPERAAGAQGNLFFTYWMSTPKDSPPPKCCMILSAW